MLEMAVGDDVKIRRALGQEKAKHGRTAREREIEARYRDCDCYRGRSEDTGCRETTAAAHVFGCLMRRTRLTCVAIA